MSQSDQEWIRALKQNEVQAEQALWELLFAAANYKKYQRDATTTDAARDAAIAAYTRIKTRALYQFRYDCPFKMYCLHIFTNEFYRRIGRVPDDDPLPDEELVGENMGLDPPAEPELIRDRLQGCLERLPPREKEVIQLRYYEGMEPDAAAARLNITRIHLNVLAFKARQKLKDCLRKMGFNSSDDVTGI